MADTRPTVWVSQPLIDAAIAPLRDRVQLRVTDTVTAWSPAQIAEQLAGADGAIITLNERIGAAQVADAAQLQVIANVGVHGTKVDLHLEQLWSRNVTITTRLVDTVSTPMLLKTVESKRLQPEQLVTHRFALDDILVAYETFSNAAASQALKVVIAT